MIVEIENRRSIMGLSAVNRASLKTYVSEWENGRRSIGEGDRRVLRSVFGLTDGELFEQVAAHDVLDAAYAELALRIEESKSVDLRMIDTLAGQTELFRSWDRQMGAPSLADQLSAHLSTLENALAYSVLPSARRPVARVLSGAATLAGWQALDVGGVDRAWRHYELARRAAVEAENPALMAHAMGEQAYVLVDTGNIDLAFDLIHEAVACAHGKVPNRVLSWLCAAEAEIAATAGRPDDSHDALERSAEWLPDGQEMRDSEVPGIFLNGTHLTRWRGNVRTLLGEPGAIGELCTALDAMDGSFTRAEGSLRIDLAQGYLACGKLGEAREQARLARSLASRTGSLRNRRRLDRLTVKISTST
ncbi:XRE family transcriptional regulator [Actinoplanes sp. HUAS TT8]|uniref:XRE family transcriptional regulator n=1 Tax=Actinoplanes sp. HUAS TT8 TaxID=3447453 RepID=UPI003F51D26C